MSRTQSTTFRDAKPSLGAHARSFSSSHVSGNSCRRSVRPSGSRLGSKAGNGRASSAAPTSARRQQLHELYASGATKSAKRSTLDLCRSRGSPNLRVGNSRLNPRFAISADVAAAAVQQHELRGDISPGPTSAAENALRRQVSMATIGTESLASSRIFSAQPNASYQAAGMKEVLNASRRGLSFSSRAFCTPKAKAQRYGGSMASSGVLCSSNMDHSVSKSALRPAGSTVRRLVGQHEGRTRDNVSHAERMRVKRDGVYADILGERHRFANNEQMLEAPQVEPYEQFQHISWGRNDMLAVALGPEVYMWSAETQQISTLLEVPEEDADAPMVSYVKWNGPASVVAVAAGPVISLWHPVKRRVLRAFPEHSGVVCAIEWDPLDAHIFVAADTDGKILVHDTRSPRPVAALAPGNAASAGAVTAMAWGATCDTLAVGFANGDVALYVLSGLRLGKGKVAAKAPVAPSRMIYRHTAPVGGLAWSNHGLGGLLATGGSKTGDAIDGHIYIWDTLGSTSKPVQSVSSKMPVTGLVWAPARFPRNELFSSHGAPYTDVILWNESLEMISRAKKHATLSMCVSSDSQRVLTVGRDENVRFWLPWPKPAASDTTSMFEASSSKLLFDAPPSAFSRRC